LESSTEEPQSSSLRLLIRLLISLKTLLLSTLIAPLSVTSLTSSSTLKLLALFLKTSITIANGNNHVKTTFATTAAKTGLVKALSFLIALSKNTSPYKMPPATFIAMITVKIVNKKKAIRSVTILAAMNALTTLTVLTKYLATAKITVAQLVLTKIIGSMTVFEMKNLTSVTGIHLIAITALTMITALKPPTTTTILSKTNAIITLTLVEMDPGYLKLHPTASTTMTLEVTTATLMTVKATAMNKNSMMMMLTLRMC